ncbi:MAG: PIN domain-containing protein [Anaerolineae bacterium]|nr:PIN domain-containing protein [Anaerolineae bacterium]
MATLIDTSALLAYVNSRDANHTTAYQAIRPLTGKDRIVPVLVELFYMSTVRLNYAQAVQIYGKTRTAFQIESITESDMAWMQAIMTQYQSAAFDFTDVSIMAIAERLNITRICTFDRRDFAIFRPTHCAYLDLLP